MLGFSFANLGKKANKQTKKKTHIFFQGHSDTSEGLLFPFKILLSFELTQNMIIQFYQPETNNKQKR